MDAYYSRALTGGAGAAIGALTGAVYLQGRKNLVFEPGTESSVRTSAR